MVRVALVLVIALCLAPLVSQAQTPQVVPGAEVVLTRAYALGNTGNIAGAISMLKGATERYPTYTRLYLGLADWQEQRALAALPVTPSTPVDERKAELRLHLNQYADAGQELLDTYGLAMMNAAEVKDIRQRIDDLTAQEFPVQLGKFGPLALPGHPTPFTFTMSDPQLPTEAQGTYQALITTTPLPVPNAYTTDPKYGSDPKYNDDPKYGHWTFQHMLLAYNYDREQRVWRLRFRVMWQEVHDQQAERLQLAQSTARLLLRLATIVHAYTGLEPGLTGEHVVNVWLAERGDVGGEAYNANIYLQQVGIRRSDTEWVRELAHEYGHQVLLPAVGGYEKPEWGANGRLGERLFMRWALLNPDTSANTLPWLQGLNATDVRERVIRPIRQFAALGPNHPQMRGTDATAMENFVGMALYLELTHGSRFLVDVLREMDTPLYAVPLTLASAKLAGFLEAVVSRETFLESTEHPVLTLRLRELPTEIPLWVWLRAGTWQGEFEVTGDTPLRLSVAVDGKDCFMDEGRRFLATGLTEGWHRISYLTAEGHPTTPTTLRLVKQ